MRNAPSSPISATEVAQVRQPVARASMLPPRVFHEADVLAFEQAAWFRAAWLCVGRVDDVARPGDYLLAEIDSQSLIVIRGEDELLRVLHNVCRHRGTRICTQESGRVVRLQCPYHAWTYELDGSLRHAGHTDALEDFIPAEQGLIPARVGTWQGFVFVTLDDSTADLAATMADLSPHVERFPIGQLRRGQRIDYEVAANWKVIAENYSECYHCPGVHPQLNRLSPYDLGHNIESNGAWCGGWMVLRDEAETMSRDGQLHGRAPLPGLSIEDERRVYYFLVWPNLLLSMHPDYVMTHRVTPLEPGRSRIVCEWFFHPEAMAQPGFDAADAVEFWDPHQPPGLGRLRAPAAGQRVGCVHGRPLLTHGGHGPRLRPDVRRRLRAGRTGDPVRAAPRQVAPRGHHLRRRSFETGSSLWRR